MSSSRSLFLLGIALWLSCRSVGPLIHTRVDQVWKYHEQVFAAAIEGPSDEDQFLATCKFFEELTGIQLHLEFFTMGALPTPESREDLRVLRAWYMENRARLYWDEAESRIKVRPAEVQP